MRFRSALEASTVYPVTRPANAHSLVADIINNLVLALVWVEARKTGVTSVQSYRRRGAFYGPSTGSSSETLLVVWMDYNEVRLMENKSAICLLGRVVE